MFTVSKSVSDETLNCIITIECSGRPNLKAETSSALGLGQFLNATWLSTVRKHRPDIFATNSEAAVLKMRTNASFAVEMLARFTEDNQRIVGMKCSGGDLYLAHFLGAGAAQKVYAADPAEPVEPLVGQAAVRANRSVLQGKTCGQVRAWAAKRMFQSAGHAWVAKYYVPPHEPTAAPDDEAAPADEPDVDDVPDTQELAPTVEDTPAAIANKDDPVIVADKPVEKPPEDKDWFEWARTLVKSKIQWAASGMGGLSLASLGGAFHGNSPLADPRVIMVVIIAVVVLLVVIIVERGRKP